MVPIIVICLKDLCVFNCDSASVDSLLGPPNLFLASDCLAKRESNPRPTFGETPGIILGIVSRFLDQTCGLTTTFSVIFKCGAYSGVSQPHRIGG